MFILITKWLKHDLTAPGSIITLFQVCNLQPRSRLVGLCTTDREGNHNHDWHNPEVSKTSMHCSLYLKIGHQSKKQIRHRGTCRCSSLDPSPERPSPCLKSHLNNFPFLKNHLKFGNQMQFYLLLFVKPMIWEGLSLPAQCSALSGPTQLQFPNLFFTEIYIIISLLSSWKNWVSHVNCGKSIP